MSGLSNSRAGVLQGQPGHLAAYQACSGGYLQIVLILPVNREWTSEALQFRGRGSGKFAALLSKQISTSFP
ncbi:hypothetical protein TNCT_600521 [Trichonephila clavata]|uniref:Uncharacterized protein n=1 Tax=Trichonephila clavata TaxID=2740835 RepID=A0A8X6LD29_TRICU|nr:hypothetical protein TNCT_600521 [Trichonephila clavata]